MPSPFDSIGIGGRVGIVTTGSGLGSVVGTSGVVGSGIGTVVGIVVSTGVGTLVTGSGIGTVVTGTGVEGGEVAGGNVGELVVWSGTVVGALVSVEGPAVVGRGVAGSGKRVVAGTPVVLVMIGVQLTPGSIVAVDWLTTRTV